VKRADLRYPSESLETKGDAWSQWSSLPMVELSALETYRFVKAHIPGASQRIVEVGCGNGYLTLELARDGHHVTGLDQSPEILEVAEWSRQAVPEPAEFGTLSYVCADVHTWPAKEGSFDVVILNRTLHHLHGFQSLLAKLRRLLTPQGVLICQDYAYDRFTEQTASWVYTMQRLLFLSELSATNPATTADEHASIDAFRTAWFERAEKREHRLNRYDEMMDALCTTFRQQLISWVPYLFVYLGNELRPLEPEKERALLTFLKQMEAHLIEQGSIQAVGFRYVGTVQA
jgi:2-polyprenyl-3-methyl-5-hydroxy-6-metoxy-1,4-benzoquinol methylase